MKSNNVLKKIVSSLAIIAILAPFQSFACTYKEAQQTMLQVNNLLAVYSRQMMEQLNKDPNNIDDSTRQEFTEKANTVGLQLAEASKDGKIQYEDKIDPSICQSYTALLDEYALEGQAPAATNATPEATSPNCSTNQLWERYAAATTQQTDPKNAGKYTKDDNNEFMKLGTLIGQYSTTDLAKACQLMGQYEALLK
ncbi:MAG: hypothetical protein ACRBHB_19610 [Arenicella sp.]